MIKSFLVRALSHRFGLAVLMTLVLVGISFLTRTMLLVASAAEVPFTIFNILGLYGIGLFYDLVNATYFIIPLVLFLWFMPARWFNTQWNLWLIYTLFFLFTLGLIFNAVSEWFFWDEFNTRYNFIAVDYLVYTTEVVGNIRQSYPIEWIITVELLLAVAITIMLRKPIQLGAQHSIRFGQRSAWALALLVLPVICFFLVNNKIKQFSYNAYVNELAGNGLYELFSAYRNNELDYDTFYNKIDTDSAFADMRAMIMTPEADSLAEYPLSIERKIHNPGPEKRLNVVLISVESFSADFMGTFGNTKNITPRLDSLVQHSLLFTKVYATGTRTVRGLEALSIAVPPTPGQSIVRRPNNEDLFSLGKVFNSKGYESKYIYGGYGYFDNMNAYFDGNGYTVVDRLALKEEEIDYENVWGVADENLFTLALREIDATVNTGKPVFAHVMTVSNHRPFTYPDGRIDIPSHTSRAGAVKYTDYAIDKFLNEARQKPWFDSTLFVVVADHCARSDGKSELPINKYHIPLLIYSPAHVSPGKMERLMSQIDLAPTLLGMLNFSYTSKFYGYDINKLEAGRERAFVSTYQSLGYLKQDTLIMLQPQQRTFTLIPNADGSALPVLENTKLMREAIVWYQTASYSFKNGLMR
jgi:phosphoglycerol transferase MdoB-like AlkP superfamily enzyme